MSKLEGRRESIGEEGERKVSENFPEMSST
jgi:hypothetical protein